ncbi:MAG: class I SAM-dependent methyltransferase, partial [Candidatus Thermochlorobacter sp.]
NKGYLRYAKDPVQSFVFAEKARFLDDVKYIYQTTEKDAEILDAGTFIPVIPLMLKFLGYKYITVAEKFSLYDGAIDPVLAAAKTTGIEVIDADITQPFSSKKYDLILLLAVIEHFSSSPLPLIQNLKTLFRTPKSRLLISAPNFARLENRIGLLLGKTPLVDIEEFLLSEPPFTGHSREYTVKDFRKLAELSGLEITHISAMSYSSPRNLRDKIFTLIRAYGGLSLNEIIRIDTTLKYS